MSSHYQCPACGSHTEEKLPDGWMRCSCGQEFNHAVREAEEAENARLIDAGRGLLLAERERVLGLFEETLSEMESESSTGRYWAGRIRSLMSDARSA